VSRRRTHLETWRSWSGLTTVRPTQVLFPTSPEEVADAVVSARAQGIGVKMVGSGHSFPDIAVTDGLLLLPDRLVGLRTVDRDAMTVTVLAGTPLHFLNQRLHRLGLALHNMGDIDRQTVAGAIATGTHGTGGRVASLSAQVVEVEIVTADGSLRRVGRASADPELFRAAQVGLGAVGIVTAVTMRVEPAFALQAVEASMRWDEVVEGFDELVAGNQHFEAYWFPHTTRMLTKSNNRVCEPVRPLSRTRAFLEDEVLENGAFEVVNRLGDLAPAAIPAMNRVVARTLSDRSYSDASHRVFPSRRRVRFREMEHALPREAGMPALIELRDQIDRSGWRIGFPVEIRYTPRDDAWLSPSYGRDSVWIAVHVNARTDHTTYFAGVEEVLKAYDGRPHWGKLHTRTAADLAPAYPCFTDFLAVRDRVDPDRSFGNAYLDRVLGP
jgi:L-gulono-1,4-lactone dehydrogenase